ncbi:uncharacterized protein LOC123262025 [Cotesia glomerata]|uniref:uncharacterized protein LOC123262025 n=1 Tax=Cotesia glomerata TaxID=32391 RepID=UPI001D00B2B6|nr:uncharacterized protein LOC123262025 [Cotesia glomerata]
MEFPPRENKNKTCCCVYGCNSRSSKNNTIRFYNFPPANSRSVIIKNKFGEDEVIDRRLAWITALKIGNKVTQSKRVCSLHFTVNDFIPTSSANPQRSHLKNISVPSCNLPQTSLASVNQPNVTQVESRNERQRQRSLKKKLSVITDASETISTSTQDDNIEDDNLRNDDQLTVEVTSEDLLLDKVFDDNVRRQKNNLLIKNCDVAIQVESEYLTPKLSSKIKTDKQLSTLTGLSNFQILLAIEKLIIKAVTIKTVIGLLYATFNQMSRIKNTFTTNKIFMTRLSISKLTNFFN